MSPKRPLIQEIPLDSTTTHATPTSPKRARTSSPALSTSHSLSQTQSRTPTQVSSTSTSTPPTDLGTSHDSGTDTESAESSVVSSDSESDSDSDDLVDEEDQHSEEDDDEAEGQGIYIPNTQRQPPVPLPTRSKLLDRVRDFLPKIREDTERLVAQGAESGFEIISVEDGAVDTRDAAGRLDSLSGKDYSTGTGRQNQSSTEETAEESGEEGQYIEMDLDLGVLEEQTDQPHSDETELEKDALSIMMGGEGRRVGKVEEVAD